MMENQTLIFLSNIQKMFWDIEEAYENEKDPLARCELAKGYLVLGDFLDNAGVLSTELNRESVAITIDSKKVGEIIKNRYL